jgi:hypothetical protein
MDERFECAGDGFAMHHPAVFSARRSAGTGFVRVLIDKRHHLALAERKHAQHDHGTDGHQEGHKHWYNKNHGVILWKFHP